MARTRRLTWGRGLDPDDVDRQFGTGRHPEHPHGRSLNSALPQLASPTASFESTPDRTTASLSRPSPRCSHFSLPPIASHPFPPLRSASTKRQPHSTSTFRPLQPRSPRNPGLPVTNGAVKSRGSGLCDPRHAVRLPRSHPAPGQSNEETKVRGLPALLYNSNS